MYQTSRLFYSQARCKRRRPEGAGEVVWWSLGRTLMVSDEIVASRILLSVCLPPSSYSQKIIHHSSHRDFRIKAKRRCHLKSGLTPSLATSPPRYLPFC